LSHGGLDKNGPTLKTVVAGTGPDLRRASSALLFVVN
jgi:hypothetical protein